jgi:hypothetical protein
MLEPVHSERQNIDAALATLGSWNLTASANGELWVKRWRRAITLDEVGILVKRMAAEIEPASLSLIIFDFTAAIMPHHKWFVCTNLVQALGQRLRIPCVLFPALAA